MWLAERPLTHWKWVGQSSTINLCRDPDVPGPQKGADSIINVIVELSVQCISFTTCATGHDFKAKSKVAVCSPCPKVEDNNIYSVSCVSSWGPSHWCAVEEQLLKTDLDTVQHHSAALRYRIQCACHRAFLEIRCFGGIFLFGSNINM